jgi:tight adherence protein B
MEPLLISLLIFAAVGSLFFGVARARQQGQERDALKGRLQKTAAVSISSDLEQSLQILRDTKMSNIPLLNRILAHMKFSTILRLWLLQARITIAPGLLVLTSGVFGAILAYLGFLITGQVLSAVTGAVVGVGMPLFYVWNARRKRFAEFARQLPDALQMMKNSLQAGHTLDRAMLVVAEEMPDPIALEFRETIEELHLGMPIKRAIQNLATRVVDDNLSIFAAALLVQREVGGNLSQLLGNLSETIRERFRINQEVRSLTAEGRMSGYIVAALPIALAVVINMIQPDYMEPLIRTETGIMLLKAAFCLEVTGFYFIRKACTINF